MRDARRSTAAGGAGAGNDEPVGDRAGKLAMTAAGTGPRVVLVHGFTQTGASWRRVSGLLEPSFRVVAVDLPGHGGSSDVRVDGLSEAAALIGESCGRASYVGYSLGGRLCLTLALERPELVERLVLVGATAGIEDPDERAARRAADRALADRLDPRGPAPAGRSDTLGASPGGAARPGPGDVGTAQGHPAQDLPAAVAPVSVADFLKAWLAGPLFAHLDAEQADVPSRVANTAAGLASSLRTVGAGEQEPSWHRLSALEMPVVLVTGGRDDKFGALAMRMAACIGPNAARLVMAGTGHAAPFEAPAAFAALVASALREGSPA